MNPAPQDGILPVVNTYMPHAYVYVIHLEEPLESCQHYVGMTRRHPKERMRDHEGEKGSRFMREVERRGIRWILAKWWRRPSVQDAELAELRIKQSRNLRRFCPICSPERFRVPGAEKPPPVAEVIPLF